MKKFILPPVGFLTVAVIIMIVVGAQLGVATAIEAWTKVSEGPCTFQSWSRNGSYVLRLNLKCNGKEAWTEDTKVTLGYIQKPGPLTCSLWASGKASCQAPK